MLRNSDKHYHRRHVPEVIEARYAQFEETTPKFCEPAKEPSWGKGFWRVLNKIFAALRLFGRSLLISDAIRLVIDTVVSE